MRGDKILAINGTPVTSEAQGLALARAAGDDVIFSILRGGAPVTVTANKPDTTIKGVTIKNLEAGRPGASGPAGFFGLFSPKTTQAAVVVTDVADGGPTSGLVMKGDKILAINGTSVTSEAQGLALTRTAGDDVVFSILRPNAPATVTLNKPEATTRLGLSIENLPYNQGTSASAHENAKVRVNGVADGCAASGRVKSGDKILAINGTPVTDEVQGLALAEAAVGDVVFSILRDDAPMTINANKPDTAIKGVTIKNLEAGGPGASGPAGFFGIFSPKTTQA